MKLQVIADQIMMTAQKQDYVRRNPEKKFVVNPKKRAPEAPVETAPEKPVEKAPEPTIEKTKKKKPYKRPDLSAEPVAPVVTDTETVKQKDLGLDDFLEEPTAKPVEFTVLPEVDIDISSPGQSAITMSMLVDNMANGAQTFMEQFKGLSDAQIQSDPERVKNGLTRLLESFSDQAYMLRSVVEEFSSQVSS